MTRVELITEIAKEWRALKKVYPNAYGSGPSAYSNDPKGWRVLALGLAIAALAEEEHGVDDWHVLLPKRQRAKRSRKD